MKKVSFIKSLIFALAIILGFSSCYDELADSILGCTDADALNYDAAANISNENCIYLSKRVVGNWKSSFWLLNGNDYVCTGFSLDYKFKEDGHFEYTCNSPDILSVSGIGKWTSSGDQLKLDYEGNSLNWRLVNALHQTTSRKTEHFTTTFEQNLEGMNLASHIGNQSLVIKLNKIPTWPIAKDNF
jgi:hypothetical protein